MPISMGFSTMPSMVTVQGLSGSSWAFCQTFLEEPNS